MADQDRGHRWSYHLPWQYVVTVNQAPQSPPEALHGSARQLRGDFVIGDVIKGEYAVTDEHFGSLTLTVSNLTGGAFTFPITLPRTYPTVPTTGEAGTWKFNTAGMPKCGYVIRLSATDRTIVNSGGIGFYSEAFIGLCLVEEPR